LQLAPLELHEVALKSGVEVLEIGEIRMVVLV